MTNSNLPNRKTIRLQGYDYRSEGLYFITICTKNREHFFGKIRNEEMELSEIGELAHKFWKEIPEHNSNIKLHAFQIMPNHTHGILEIIKSSTADACIGPTHRASSPMEAPAAAAAAPENTSTNKKMAAISPKAGSISRIIGSYKSAVTKHSRMINPNFGWQYKYHDNIIRDDRAFDNISRYIINNPKNWNKDKFSN